MPFLNSQVMHTAFLLMKAAHATQTDTQHHLPSGSPAGVIPSWQSGPLAEALAFCHVMSISRDMSPAPWHHNPLFTAACCTFEACHLSRPGRFRLSSSCPPLCASSLGHSPALVYTRGTYKGSESRVQVRDLLPGVTTSCPLIACPEHLPGQLDTQPHATGTLDRLHASTTSL